MTCDNVDSGTADFEVTNDVNHGTLMLGHTDGSYKYTPDNNFNGTDSFQFTVNDTDGLSNTATFTFTVNAPPVCSVGSSTTTENSPVTDPFDCTDADGDNLGLHDYPGSGPRLGGRPQQH